jgi:hypothetical protein
MVMLSVTPIPYFDFYIKHNAKSGVTVYYFLSEIMLSVMAFRLFYIVRAYFNYSIYADSYSKKLFQQYGFESNLRFAFKANLINDPQRTIGLIFVSFVLFYSYLLRIFELPYFRAVSPTDPTYRQFDDFFSANWCCIITLTTVGYGDMTPCTTPGRIVTITIAMTGSFLMALVVAMVTSQTELSPKHQVALHHMQLTRYAATTIQYSFKYFQLKKKYHTLRAKLQLPKTKFQTELEGIRSQIYSEDLYERQVDAWNEQKLKSKLEKMQEKMHQARVKMIQQVRVFIHERNTMDTIIADERRTMFTTQHDMSKTVERIDSNMEDLQDIIKQQQAMMRQMMQYMMLGDKEKYVDIFDIPQAKNDQLNKVETKLATNALVNISKGQ